MLLTLIGLVYTAPLARGRPGDLGDQRELAPVCRAAARRTRKTVAVDDCLRLNSVQATVV